MDALLQDANDAQKAAITAPYGPVMIVAGPGTGKTKTLTTRIAYILLQGVPAHEILALTFTNKAAREMGERLKKMTNASKAPTIATFHALCLAILQEEHAQSIHFATDAERTQAVKAALTQTSRKGLSVRQATLVIAKAKGSLRMPPEDESLVAAYNVALRAKELSDFDDLICDTYHLLRQNKQVRVRLRARYRHILIDEFQDTSELQWWLVQVLRGSDSVFVIGDPKQSIYGFRGATQDMFAVFRADFLDCTEISLDTNYRSRPHIVFMANAIFSDSGVALRPHQEAPGSVRVMQTLNEYSEADAVLAMIEQGVGGTTLLNAASESGGRHFRDFAIVYRTHRAAKIVERRLYDSGIPYQVVGEGSPYEQPEIRAVIDVLRWMQTGEGELRAPGFTSGQVRALMEDVAIDAPVSRIAQAIAAKLNLAGDDDKKRLRLSQFIGTLVRFDARPQGLAACARYFDTIEAQDFYDSKADAVTLLTIHAAKGLEFTSVIVLAAEEGILPHIRRSEAPNIEEERRLFYVAATRAKQELTFIYTKKRGSEPSELSRFVAAISEQLLPRVDDPNLAQTEKRLHRRQQKARQATLF